MRPATELARTNWGMLLAWLGLAAACSVALALGISSTTKVQKFGTPCVAVKEGKHKGEPSKGCFRIAELLSAACRKRPKLCTAVAGSLIEGVGRDGRDALLQAIRAQRRAEARARRRAEAHRRGSPPSRPPPGARPVRPPPAQTPPGSSAPPGQPPPQAQTPPPPRRTPQQEVEHVIQHPGEVVTNPGGTVQDLGCSLGERLCGLPVVPVPPIR